MTGRNQLWAGLMILVLVLTFPSCAKKEDLCADYLISHLDLESHDGQDIGCRLFYNLYEAGGKQYAMIDNYCADMYIDSVIDCNGTMVLLSSLPAGETVQILGIVR